jgi:transposase
MQQQAVPLGVDISKATFDVAICVNEKVRQAHFKNAPDGYEKLLGWLAKWKVDRVHACMESTGGHERALAEFLHQRSHVVSIVNPARIKGFAQSQMARAKTDRYDARLIERFCRQQQPEPWSPPPPELERLQALMRRLDDLKGMRQQEGSRWTSARQADERASIERVVTFLDEQIRELEREIDEHIDQTPSLRRDFELLKSIKGVGTITARVMLVMALRRFGSARQAVAFVGLAPRPHESGTSVRTRAWLCKTGSSRLRTALYFPALAAGRHDPAFQAFRERLEARGKPGMVVVAALMRKLVTVAFGVLKSETAYNPELAAARAR